MQEPDVFALSHTCFEGLVRKFEAMSVSELRREKARMVKDLQQINDLLDELITEQQDGQLKIDDIEKQIIKCRRKQRSLTKELQNFEFMLTSDYQVQVEEEIARLKAQLRSGKEEVNKFTRMIEVPMEKDMKVCENLEKQVFGLEKQLQEIRIKNLKKKDNIASLHEQNERKAFSIKMKQKEINKIMEEIEMEGFQNEPSEQLARTYEQLLQRKNKLHAIQDKQVKKYERQYNERVKSYTQIEQASAQIQHYLQQIGRSLHQKQQQLRAERHRKQVTRRKHTSETHITAGRRNKTQHSSELELMNRQRQLHYDKLSRIKFKHSSAYHSRNEDKTTIETTDQLLPKLYKALGKQRFQIEQDCDVRELLYM